MTRPHLPQRSNGSFQPQRQCLRNRNIVTQFCGVSLGVQLTINHRHLSPSFSALVSGNQVAADAATSSPGAAPRSAQKPAPATQRSHQPGTAPSCSRVLSERPSAVHVGSQRRNVNRTVKRYGLVRVASIKLHNDPRYVCFTAWMHLDHLSGTNFVTWD